MTKFRTFKYNKLVRDKIVDQLEQRGSVVHWKKLDNQEFAQQLKRKITEEAYEISQARTKNEMLEELADILEVVESLCHLHACTLQDIIDIKNKKFQERGGFQERKFICTVEHSVGSSSEQYCLNQPDKYPEIKKSANCTKILDF